MKQFAAIFLSAALCLGCTGCHRQNAPDSASSANPAPPEHPLGLHLTDEPDMPATHGGMQYADSSFDYSLLCENEYGYYFTGHYHSVIRTETYESPCILYNTVCYADKETGTTLPLCPRPNCLHDGSLYCTATTEAYQTHSRLLLHGDGLYATALCDGKATVLRYAPDGTEITAFARFDKHPKYNGFLEFSCTPIIHRGYLFTVLRIGNCHEEVLAVDRIQSDYQGGFQIVACELRTGKTTIVYECLPPFSSDCTTMYYTPTVLFADGDFLYFDLAADPYERENTKAPALNLGLNRVNLLNGETEYVDKHRISFLADGHAYYLSYSKQSADIQALYALNLDTHTITDICTLPDADSCQILADETYLYVFFKKLHADTATLQLYDHSATLLAEKTFPHLDAPFRIAAKDGMFYLTCDAYTGEVDANDIEIARTDVRFLDVNAWLQGDFHWETAFSVDLFTDAWRGAAGIHPISE